MENHNSKPERRKRYKGTHPKSFKEKYKELNPEQYANDIEKVIKQGKTPAGMHRSICVKEIMDFFQLEPGQVGLDATLGYGGHSLEILERITPGGHLYATDVDPFELPRTQQRLLNLGYGPEVLTIRRMNFSEIDQIVAESGPLNFVLADLGVSSMQIDNPERGFSFKIEGPLDLRLNPKSGKSAAQFLKSVEQEGLEEILEEYADEPHAKIISKVIVNHLKKGNEISTTRHLREIIKQALSFIPELHRAEEIKKSCQRCFQALRIEVNREFEVLDKFLSRLPTAMAANGKIAILSFHSGEDRRVKKSFQELYRLGIFKEIAPEVIRPGVEECAANPRAKSAILRWAIMA